ncbi:hypothetical protein BCV70DRAFT_235084 [Testicularia cyperi]|uniref:CCHC-type domain-containing protein n=1 Tax=Testicularia cyperi TaxID=1882483 RepID=A0A317Y187_9BASI|nr:hypothetical protein BCV70DRAFT_235084 [Testicularia cyperi]
MVFRRRGCYVLVAGGIGKGEKACYTCGDFGHIARLCPSAPTASATTAPSAATATASEGAAAQAATTGGAPAAASRAKSGPIRCRRCNGPNHFARDCQAASPGASGRKPKACYVCSKPGHIAKACPEAPTMAEAPGSNAAAALTA